MIDHIQPSKTNMLSINNHRNLIVESPSPRIKFCQNIWSNLSIIFIMGPVYSSNLQICFIKSWLPLLFSSLPVSLMYLVSLQVIYTSMNWFSCHIWASTSANVCSLIGSSSKMVTNRDFHLSRIIFLYFICTNYLFKFVRYSGKFKFTTSQCQLAFIRTNFIIELD